MRLETADDGSKKTLGKLQQIDMDFPYVITGITD
jgi:hypothetical protein